MHRMAGGALVGDDLAVIQGIGSDAEVSSSRSYRWMPSISWKGGGKSRGFGGDGADGSQPMLVLEKAAVVVEAARLGHESAQVIAEVSRTVVRALPCESERHDTCPAHFWCCYGDDHGYGPLNTPCGKGACLRSCPSSYDVRSESGECTLPEKSVPCVNDGNCSSAGLVCGCPCDDEAVGSNCHVARWKIEAIAAAVSGDLKAGCPVPEFTAMIAPSTGAGWAYPRSAAA